MKTITSAILIGILMTPIMLFAAPHEPSPAGGGWLELNPKLGQVQTDAPWFPELTGELTIEAWIYVDEPLSKQVIFSLVGQTDRFNCFLIGTPVDEDEDGILDTEPGILSQGTTEHSGTMRGNLPIRQWVHYVATINRGATVGSDGYIAEGVDGSELPAPNENRLVLGGIPVISGIPMMPGFKARFASGVYIDELRISSVVRYKGNYAVPTKTFTADTHTIGLYHFDAESNQSYEDSSNSQIPLIRSEIDPEVLAEIEEATASPVLSKSEGELLQLIREGIAYYDSLLESGRVDFFRETTSVASDGLPEMERAPSGTWKGTFEFSGRKMRCVVTRDVIQYEPDRNIPITGTQQYAYDGETFETLRETFNGIVLSRRSEIVDDPFDDPRFWGWDLSGGGKESLVMLIDELEVESIKEVRFDESDVYHIKGNAYGVAIELWLNPKKSYRPERYVFANPMIAITKDSKFKEVAPDLWFPESAKSVTTVIDVETDTKTDATTTTVQFTNIRINEPIPESRFSIEPPPGATVFDMRTQESFEVPVSD
ncbi:MAG: hypothetical protein OXH39_21970 [Candidatus Poribacteria bacterium]|nr:hypothetical protein [Candidatus Poribacteria bacterium]